MAYTLSTTAGFVTAEAIIGMLDPAIAIQAAHAQAIRNLQRGGCRYSNQDFDVLAAAYCVARERRTEVHPYEAKWVEAMTARRS